MSKAAETWLWKLCFPRPMSITDVGVRLEDGHKFICVRFADGTESCYAVPPEPEGSATR